MAGVIEPGKAEEEERPRTVLAGPVLCCGPLRRELPAYTWVLPVVLLEYLAMSLVSVSVPALESTQFQGNEYLIVGAASGVNGLLSVFGTPTIGRLSDAVGRKWLMLLTVSVTVLPACLLLFTTNMWVYEALRAVTGIVAATFSLAFAVVADLTTGPQRAAGIGLIVGTFGAAFSVGPLIATGLLEAFGPVVPAAAVVVLSACNLAYIALVMPESLPERSRAAATCRHVRSPLETLSPLLRHPALRVVGVVVFFVNVAEQGLISLVVSYLQRHLGFGPFDIAMFALTLGLLMAVSQSFLFPVLVRRISAKRLIVAACLANATHTALYGFATEHWQVFGIVALASFAFLGFPAVADIVSRMTPRERQGQYQGAVTGVRALTIGFGPSLFGAVLTATCPAAAASAPGFSLRCATTFLIAAGLVLVGAAASLWLPEPEDLERISEEIRALSGEAEAAAGDADDELLLAASPVATKRGLGGGGDLGDALLADAKAMPERDEP